MFQLRTEWIPTVWHLENYPNALSRAAFVQYFVNSGIVSLIVMIGNVVFAPLPDTAWRIPFSRCRTGVAADSEHADAPA